jgi:hypothetical protein
MDSSSYQPRADTPPGGEENNSFYAHMSRFFNHTPVDCTSQIAAGESIKASCRTHNMKPAQRPDGLRLIWIIHKCDVRAMAAFLEVTLRSLRKWPMEGALQTAPLTSPSRLIPC